MKTIPKCILCIFITSITYFWFASTAADAAPYFYITGPTKMYPGASWDFQVYLYSDSNTITAAQTVIGFDSTAVQTVAITNISSICSFWAPADPSLGYGSKSSPYFKDGNKLVISCGFSNPGYVSGTGQGGLVLKFSLTPKSGLSGSKTTAFTSSNTKLLYIDNNISPGSFPSFSTTAYSSTASAVAQPTATPTPRRTASTTLNDSDLNFVNIASGSSSTSGSSSGLSFAQAQELNLAQSNSDAQSSSQFNSIDNSIPPPPANLEPRSPITPFPTPIPPEDQQEAIGEVLSIQSLRELLLPGKSDADQRIVWINLLSLLTFLIVLTILIWRLITVSRMNKIKSRHMKELLTGELSVLESQLGQEANIDEEEFSQSIEKLKQEIDQT